MKKIKTTFLVGLLALFAVQTPSFAHDDMQLIIEKQKEVMETGFRILNANNIDKRMTFYYEKNYNVNAKVVASSKRNVVFLGMAPFIEDETERAALLSTQIANNLEYHEGLWQRTTNSLTPKKSEKRADCRAVDLMVNSGYNPVGLIIVMNKLLSEPNWFDFFQGTRGSKRMLNVYKYIYEKYPQYLADNEYYTNIYYQNFLITTKKSRAQFKKNLDEKNLAKSNKKAKKHHSKKEQQQEEQI